MKKTPYRKIWKYHKKHHIGYFGPILLTIIAVSTSLLVNWLGWIGVITFFAIILYLAIELDFASFVDGYKAAEQARASEALEHK